MKLFNIQISPPVLLAEIDDAYEVKFLHPLIKRSIDMQKGAIVQSIKALSDQFGGRTRVPSSDPKFGRALYYQLDYDYVQSNSEAYRWLTGEEVKKFLGGTQPVRKVQDEMS